MTQVELRGVSSEEGFYDAMVKQLNLPAHFGRNLDALYDTLTRDVPGPVEVRWAVGTIMTKDIEKIDRVMDVLRKVAKERSDFTFHMS